jgi:hypothetical protein
MSREELPMPELLEFRTAGGLGEMIRRVVKENTIELLRDTESNDAVALVSLDRLVQLLEEADSTVPVLAARLRQCLTEERERDQRARALAGRLATREAERRSSRDLPWEIVKSDPAWQQKWNALLAEIRKSVPPDATSDDIEAEIEAEIEAAREAAHQEKRAGRP